jgi:tripeptide aminopeptidase
MSDYLQHREGVLRRFLRYVQVDTTADPTSDSIPSSQGQLTLGRMLADELRELGVPKVVHDRFGLVWGLLPASLSQFEDAPLVMLNSHVDTSPEAPGANVRPVVIDSYNGEPIALGTSGHSIDAVHCPALAALRGAQLVVTQGDTLLGADDKGGVATIMQLVEHLLESKRDHGPLLVLFTCDEEIGLGTRCLSIRDGHLTSGDHRVPVPTVAYTLDGGDQGKVDEETFSADRVEVHFTGVGIHPSIGKGRMVNALKGVAQFIAALPEDRLSPETTDGREGFVHPYDLNGGVDGATLQLLLRDFDESQLTTYRRMLEEIAARVEQQIPGIRVKLTVHAQYRNMALGLRQLPESVDYAIKAYRDLGVECERTIVRGGTDGSQFTAMGIPTPNLSVGQHNIHSVKEFACTDQMALAVEHLVLLLGEWARHGASGDRTR